MTDFWENLPLHGLATEADVELRLVVPLLHALGYEDSDIAPKHPVVFQEGRVGRRPEPDYVCFNGPTRDKSASLLVVEAKKPGEALQSGKAQGESYARNQLSPILIMTNGKMLEIWQLQTTQESALVLRSSTSDLRKNRGKIERYANKTALLAYCKTLQFKSIVEASADYNIYIDAELKRTTNRRVSIERTLQRPGSNNPDDCVKTGRLIDSFPNGACIIAASGYGKTTLANSLFRQAIQALRLCERIQLAFEISLPDFAQSQISFLEFLHRRLSPHCPGVTISALEQILIDEGACLVCDSFDRVAPGNRALMQSHLGNLVRDYPKTQIFIFSRRTLRPNVDLPILELRQLGWEEMLSIEKSVFTSSDVQHSVVRSMPKILFDLCKTPLLLEQALVFFKSTRTLPTQLSDLFQSWLENILKVEPSEFVTAIEREKGLAVIATSTVNSPIAGEEALNRFKQIGLRPEILNDLIACDALSSIGSIVEVQHEAMADYLRAKTVASLKEDAALDALANLPVVDGALFPSLLMATLTTNRLQSAWWRRLAGTNIQAYGDALRYRYDTSAEMKKLDANRLSYEYLHDLLDGIEVPLLGSFAELRGTVARYLLRNCQANFAVQGLVHSDQNHLTYMLQPRVRPETPRITIGFPDSPGERNFLNLELLGLRLDSGRQLGTRLLCETILKIVKQQDVNGGAIWAAERLLGRVRYLVERCGFPIALNASLDSVETLLSPDRGKTVLSNDYRNESLFSINSMLDDIQTMRRASMDKLDPWWLRLGWNKSKDVQKDEVISAVMDEHFRRVQLAFAEVVETSFPRFSKAMNFYTALPVCWDISYVHPVPPRCRGSFAYRVLPVASWDEAGATTTFSDQPLVRSLDFDLVRRRLLELGRSASNFPARSGSTIMFDVDGHQWTGHFDGATSVVHEVCDTLKKSLEEVFEAVP